jgi:GWxTD domain-containing protein
MRQFLIVSFFTLAAFISVNSQDIQPTELKNSFSAPKYYEDFLNFSAGKDSLTRLDVFVMVPYTSIKFVKPDKVFVGRYSVTVSVFDKDKKKLINEKLWNEKVEATDYNQTTLKDNSSLSFKSFYLTPDEYSIRTSIHDEESNLDFTGERKVTVRNFSAGFAISDIMILKKGVENEPIKKIVPDISGDVTMQKEGLPIFYEIYSRAPCKLNLKYIISDKKKNQIFEESHFKEVDSGKTQVFYTIKDSSLNLGYYNLQVLTNSTDNLLLASTQKSFLSRWAGVPSLITDLDKAVDEMVYIASPKDLDYIKDAPNKDEKLKRYLAYWKKMNPAPETEDNELFDEYYNRVFYANEHFSQFLDGWKTDRGMVFILLGPPDNVQRHPFDMDSKPYEIWEYYNLNQSLVFFDETGFGDYRLVTPLTGDLYRFRR